MEKKGVAIFGDVAVDFDRMEIRRSDQIIHTRALEFRMLKFFVKDPNYVFSREELIKTAWPERKRVSRRTVDNFIAHLRRKLEEDPSCPVYLQTVPGAGYKFLPMQAGWRT